MWQALERTCTLTHSLSLSLTHTQPTADFYLAATVVGKRRPLLSSPATRTKRLLSLGSHKEELSSYSG